MDKREYKITKSDLGYNVYRRKEEDDMVYVEWLDFKSQWSLHRQYAKHFYNRDDALSALIIMRIKGEKTDTTSSEAIEEKGREKQTWSEL